LEGRREPPQRNTGQTRGKETCNQPPRSKQNLGRKGEGWSPGSRRGGAARAEKEEDKIDRLAKSRLRSGKKPVTKRMLLSEEKAGLCILFNEKGGGGSVIEKNFSREESRRKRRGGFGGRTAQVQALGS